jgi:hypothetical protein
MCCYRACDALALERLSREEDGRIAWRIKRPLPDGTTHFFFNGLELLRRLASLVLLPRETARGVVRSGRRQARTTGVVPHRDAAQGNHL